MRSEFIGVWSKTWREIWLPLIDHEGVPADIFCELYRELAGNPEEARRAQSHSLIRGARRHHRQPSPGTSGIRGNELHFIQWHHVIPKSLLKAQGYETGEINESANMAFITDQTNRRISNKEATGYLADIVAKQGEAALTSQCVPTDHALWATDRYREILQSRRAELARRMNAFIEEKAGL